MKSLLENKKFKISLIVVLVLIILLLLGLVINNVNKINKQQDQKLQAMEMVQEVLEMARVAKESNENYNSNEYLDNLFKSNNITVNGNIVSSNGYNFEIDRESLNISNELGSTNVDIIDEVTGSAGKDESGRDLGKINLRFTSNIPIDKIQIENIDGTILEEDVNNTTYEKEIDVVFGHTHVISAVTSDGKISVKKVTKENPYPQISNPSTASGVRTANPLNFTWPQIEEIAKAISNDSTITNNTQEFTIKYKGNEYIIGVGDYTTVNDKKVRIMGFNHDRLTDQNAYGGTNTYAGISFEFVEFIERMGMKDTATNSEGWEKSIPRERLNNEIIDNLENKEYIKQVNKNYLVTYRTMSTSQNKLWLLACSEIWNNGWYGVYTYGTVNFKEGEQYKYYKNVNAIAHTKNANIVKEGAFWWLRSPGGKQTETTIFSCVKDDGSNYWHTANYACGIAPGFCI